MLELSPVVRLPRPDELPNDAEIHARLKQRERANIVEGFVLRYNTAHDLPYKYYAEINVNNSRLWAVFIALADLLPGEVSCIYNTYGEDPAFSPYTGKTAMLNILEHYKLELVQDCNLEFGMMFQSDDKLEEVFVTEAKYLKVWGNHEVHFRTVMVACGIREGEALNFIDEYPKVVEPLTSINEQARHTGQVIAEMEAYFKA